MRHSIFFIQKSDIVIGFMRSGSPLHLGVLTVVVAALLNRQGVASLWLPAWKAVSATILFYPDPDLKSTYQVSESIYLKATSPTAGIACPSLAFI